MLPVMTNTTNTETKQMIAARKLSGDTLVTKAGGYSFSTTGGGSLGGTVQLGCCKHEPHTYRIVARDPMDGAIFATREDAEAYGYEAGHLVWFSDWKAGQ